LFVKLPIVRLLPMLLFGLLLLGCRQEFGFRHLLALRPVRLVHLVHVVHLEHLAQLVQQD
jgi:hypothetical protein